MMNIKYLKNPKTREKFYPITKSDCIIDAFSINDLEIDKLFSDGLSVSKHQNGMSYLNLQGLIHYHSKIKDYFNSAPDVQIYTAGENITIEDNVISAVVPEVDLSGYATEEYVDQEIANIDIPILNNTKTKEEVINSTDGVYYFTPDTKQIYRNGESYGGNITAEDVETLPEEGIQVQAVTFIKNYESYAKSEFTILPNYKYIFGDRTKLTIQLDSNVNQNIVNHYLFEFNSGDVATTLTLPSYIKWTSEPSIKQNKTYQISIENNLGVIQEWT